MSATDHTNHYSAADIQRYLAGELPPAEMHALELAALDDPFLADAIEGMQQSLAQKDKTPIDTGLQELQRRLQERVTGEDRRQSAPVVAFRWWQAAAAAAVIIIGSIWVFNASQDSSPEAKEIAMVQTQEKRKAETPAAASDSVAISSNIVADPQLAKSAKPVTDDVSSKVAEKDNVQYNAHEKREDVALQKTYKPLPTPASANNEAKLGKQLEEVIAAKKADQPAATRNTLNYELLSADTNRIATAKKNLASQRNQLHANQFSNTATRDFEQIVVSKTPRDTSAAGYLSKPRELTMNMSRKELSARQAKKNPDALLSGFVSGRVTDNATNSPISNAMVRIEGARDFFTDNKGWFKIPVTDSVVNVAVGTSGYYTQNLRLNNNSSNVISLNQLGDKAPNPNLNVLQGRVAGIQANHIAADSFPTEANIAFNYADSFVADSAYSTAVKAASRRSKTNPLAQSAEPVYGWVKFQQYLDQNKQLPANGTAGAGKVVVAFKVDKKGVPADLNVLSSPGQAYSNEAIRLIKAGPSWKLLKGRKGITTVVITF